MIRPANQIHPHPISISHNETGHEEAAKKTETQQPGKTSPVQIQPQDFSAATSYYAPTAADSLASVAVEEQRPVDGGEVQEHDHEDEEVVKVPEQPQHACTPRTMLIHDISVA